MEWIARAQQNPWARITGVVYLLYFLTAILAQLLVGRGLVTLGNATNVFATVLYVFLTLLLYLLFKPVSRSLSLLAALFSLAGCVVTTIAIFLPSLPINPLLFFAPYCMLLGYLIFRSRFLPWVLGVLMALAGLGWLAFESPALPHYLSLSIEGLGVVAEASLMLWLLVMSVNAEKWNQQASRAGASIRTPAPSSTTATGSPPAES
jgi:hypothetical protein